MCEKEQKEAETQEKEDEVNFSHTDNYIAYKLSKVLYRLRLSNNRDCSRIEGLRMIVKL